MILTWRRVASRCSCAFALLFLPASAFAQSLPENDPTDEGGEPDDTAPVPSEPAADLGEPPPRPAGVSAPAASPPVVSPTSPAPAASLPILWPTSPAPAVALPAPNAEAEPESHWYGGQTLAADGLSVGLLIAGGQAESATLAWLGLFGYAFGAPIVHGIHQRSGAAFGSLALRIGAPVLGGAIGLSSAGDCGGELCALGPMVAGIFIGATAAIVIDSAALAWEEEPEAAPMARVVPSFAVTPHGAALGAVGTF